MTENISAFYNHKFLFTEKSHHENLLCDLRTMKMNLGGGRIGWMYPKNSMLRPLFDKFLVTQDETGVEQSIRMKYFEPPLGECSGDTGSETSVIGYDLVINFFFFLIIGSVGAIVIAGIERLTKSYKC